MIRSLPTGSVSLYNQASSKVSDNQWETQSGPRISILLLSTLQTWEQSLRLSDVFSKHQINFIGSVKWGLIYSLFWNGFLMLDNKHVMWRFMISKDLKSYSEVFGVHHFQNWSWIVLVSLKQHMYTHRGTHMQECTHMCMCHTQAYTFANIHTHIYMHVCTCTHMKTYTLICVAPSISVSITE